MKYKYYIQNLIILLSYLTQNGKNNKCNHMENIYTAPNLEILNKNNIITLKKHDNFKINA